MARYTVSEVAAMAHVSVRTLHHYHEIGLLHPAVVGENGVDLDFECFEERRRKAAAVSPLRS